MRSTLPHGVVLPGDESIDESIYLQYGGLVRNTGAHTITFGYFNHNHSEVTVQPDEDNKLLPAPLDRQQPREQIPHRKFLRRSGFLRGSRS